MWRSVRLGVVLALVVVFAADRIYAREGSTKAQPGKSAAKGAAAATDYLPTPHGHHHRSCIHDVGDGAVVDANGKVTLASGKPFVVPRCAFPARVPPRSDGKQPAPPSTNGWVLDTNWVSASPLGAIKATWTVPPPPTVQSGQLVYFFPSMVPSTANTSPILQPVLQWGVSPAGGGPYWAIASWYCNTAPGVCLHSGLARVQPGDPIAGTVQGSGCTPQGVCTWKITSRDVKTGAQKVLTAKDPHSFFWAQGGVLEAYNIITCTNYPAAPSTIFSNIVVSDLQGRPLAPAWVPGLYNPQPSFSFARSR
jgi:hypothetical protein